MHSDFHRTLQLLRGTQLTSIERVGFSSARGGAPDLSREIFRHPLKSLDKAADLDPSRADLEFNLALAQFRADRLDDARPARKSARFLATTRISKT